MVKLPNSEFKVNVNLPLTIFAETAEQAKTTANNILSENSNTFSDMFDALGCHDDLSDISVFAVVHKSILQNSPIAGDEHACLITFLKSDEGDNTRNATMTQGEFNALKGALSAYGQEYELDVWSGETGRLTCEVIFCFDTFAEHESDYNS